MEMGMCGCWQMCHKKFRVETNTTLGIQKQYKSPAQIEVPLTPVNGYKAAK